MIHHQLNRKMEMQQSNANAANNGPRPRLLALHGWRTSAAVLAQQMERSGLSRAVGDVAELVYLDGPHPARGPPTPDVARAFAPPFFEWWDAVQDSSAAGQGGIPGAIRYEGADATLALLEAEMRAAAAAGRPVAGLVGFSQGAILASLVAVMQERGVAFQDVPRLRCAVLIAGGVARDPAFAHLYGTSAPGGVPSAASPLPAGLALPSVHVFGSADPLRANSERLLAAFREPLVLRHEQGHVVPRLVPEQLRELQELLAVHLSAMATPTPMESGDLLGSQLLTRGSL